LTDFDWNAIEILLDAGILSDEAGKGSGANFTGASVGIRCNNMTRIRKQADFHFRCCTPLAVA
jgi:xylan 1,4-beta-xylosidase